MPTAARSRLDHQPGSLDARTAALRLRVLLLLFGEESAVAFFDEAFRGFPSAVEDFDELVRRFLGLLAFFSVSEALVGIRLAPFLLEECQEHGRTLLRSPPDLSRVAD